MKTSLWSLVISFSFFIFMEIVSVFYFPFTNLIINVLLRFFFPPAAFLLFVIHSLVLFTAL